MRKWYEVYGRKFIVVTDGGETSSPDHSYDILLEWADSPISGYEDIGRIFVEGKKYTLSVNDQIIVEDESLYVTDGNFADGSAQLIDRSMGGRNLLATLANHMIVQRNHVESMFRYIGQLSDQVPMIAVSTTRCKCADCHKFTAHYTSKVKCNSCGSTKIVVCGVCYNARRS